MKIRAVVCNKLKTLTKNILKFESISKKLGLLYHLFVKKESENPGTEMLFNAFKLAIFLQRALKYAVIIIVYS